MKMLMAGQTDKMAGKTHKIAVIGAGVCGLSTALRLQAADPSLDITIIAETFSPGTTSDGAAGIWSPTFLGDTPMETRKRWGKATYDYLNEILRSEDAVKLGVSQCSGYFLSDQTVTDEFPYEDIVARHIRLSSQDLKKLNLPPDIKDGFFVTDIVFLSTLFMQAKIKEFQQEGGNVIKRRVQSFNEFVGTYDVVVNCSGLGALKLCKDEMMQPVRGQIMKIKAPWLKHFYKVVRHAESSEKKEKICYIFPRPYDVIIGGTSQFGSSKMTISEEENKYIVEESSKYEPTVKNAEVITTWVGLRPFRTLVRLEKEVMRLTTEQGSVKTLQVVHNYGHGGSGLSVFWGCAGEARDLALSFLK